MAMAKKDYELVARSITRALKSALEADRRRELTNPNLIASRVNEFRVYMTAVMLANDFQTNYENFNRTRFMVACGFPPNLEDEDYKSRYNKERMM